jgi:predicted component of type VI protein secretion system
MNARLVITSGSKAGLAAPIEEGVYLVGRDRMCQIRPYSRSVSRRHCALFKDTETLRVLDLNSTSGTRVNGERIPVRRRVQLFDGDQLRCGNTTFNVIIGHADETPLGCAPVDCTREPENCDIDEEPTIVRGGPMREDQLAEYLEGKDEVELERVAGSGESEDGRHHQVSNAPAIERNESDFDTDPQAMPSDSTTPRRDDVTVGRRRGSHGGMLAQTVPLPSARFESAVAIVDSEGTVPADPIEDSPNRTVMVATLGLMAGLGVVIIWVLWMTF